MWGCGIISVWAAVRVQRSVQRMRTLKRINWYQEGSKGRVGWTRGATEQTHTHTVVGRRGRNGKHFI